MKEPYARWRVGKEKWISFSVSSLHYRHYKNKVKIQNISFKNKNFVL